ncbi:nuclear transport factor 2 family protein [Ekhidna sp.]
MKAIKLTIIALALLLSWNINAQQGKSEEELIRETLMHYIEGTANGEPERIKKAFHKDLNLYTSDKGQLKVRSGEKYISYFKEGQKVDRVGKIISIDFEQNAAMAKAEIIFPNKRIFTDYFLLLKLENEWKIIHKSYTWRNP